MSRAAPLNATVTVLREGGTFRVEKVCHRRFTIHDELAAYEAIQPLVASVPKARTPKLLSVNEAESRLTLEFIHGPSLQEALRFRGGDVLEQWGPTILDLMVHAYHENVAFDFDPTNVILEEARDQLCLIDAVCVDLGLRHHAAVVMFFGLLKYRLRDPNPLHYRGLAIRSARLYQHYLERTGRPGSELRTEIGVFLRAASDWNREPNDVENAMRQLLRRYLAAPVYDLLAIIVKPGLGGEQKG